MAATPAAFVLTGAAAALGMLGDGGGAVAVTAAGGSVGGTVTPVVKGIPSVELAPLKAGGCVANVGSGVALGLRGFKMLCQQCQQPLFPRSPQRRLTCR